MNSDLNYYLKKHLIYNNSTFYTSKIIYELLKILQKSNHQEINTLTSKYLRFIQNDLRFKVFLHIFDDRHLAKQTIDEFFFNLPNSYTDGYNWLFKLIFKTIDLLYNNLPIYMKLIIPYSNAFITITKNVQLGMKKMNDSDISEVIDEFINSFEKQYSIELEKEKEKEEEEEENQCVNDKSTECNDNYENSEEKNDKLF